MANLLQSIKSWIYKAWYKAGELAESAGKEIDKAKEWAVQLGKDLIADPVTAMENFSKAAEQPVKQIIDTGATAWKYIGAWLDVVNPANLAERAISKIKGTEYKPMEIAQPIGEALWETVGTMAAGIGTLPIKLSESTFKVNKAINDYQSWIVDTPSAALTIADEVGKGGLAVIGAIAPAKYTKMVTGIQTVMRESGASDFIGKTTDVIGNTIADTLNVKDEKQREQVRSLTNTSQGILSLLAGMKGWAMAKQGKTLAETAKNVTKGTLVAATPDLATVAVGQAMWVGEEEGSNIDALQKSKIAAASVLWAFSPADGMNVKSKAKTSKEQTSMEVEVPKVEMEKPTVEAEIIKEKVEKIKPNLTVEQIKNLYTRNFYLKNWIRETNFNSNRTALKWDSKWYTLDEFLSLSWLKKDDFELLEWSKWEDWLYVLKDRNVKTEAPVVEAKPTKQPRAKKPLTETVKGKTKERQPEPEQTQQKLEWKTPEDTTIPFEAPTKSELTSDTIPFEDTKEKKDDRTYQPNYEAVKTDIDNIMWNLTPENVSVSKSAESRVLGIWPKSSSVDPFFTIGWLVERGLGKAGNYYITLRNLMQTARNSDPVFYDSMKKTMDVDADNYKFGRKFDVTEDMVIGRLTPNVWLPITSLKQIQNMIDGIIPKDLVEREWEARAEALRDTAKASLVYELNKDNPEFLAKTFTPDELKMLEWISNKEAEITSNTWNVMIDKWLLPSWKKVDDYIRYVVNDIFRNKMWMAFDIMKQKKKEEFEARLIEEMLTKTEKGMVAEENKNIQGLDAVWVSSLKEKSKVKELDYERIHSPLIRMFSVLSETSKALRNKTLTDQVKEFVKLGHSKKASQKEKDFIFRMFPKQAQSMLAAVMWLESVENTPAQKAAKVASWFTRAWVKQILFGNLVTAVQPVVSTLPKWAYITATRSLPWVGKWAINPINAFSEEVRRDLWAFWFTPPYETVNSRVPWPVAQKLAKLNNTFGGYIHTMDEWINKWTWVFSGSWLEYPVKVYTSLTMMRAELRKNWIEATTNPKDITAKWKEFSKNPNQKAEFQQAQDKIQETLSWLGESTIFNKSAVQTIRETDLQALKGYMNSQTNKLLRDISVASGRTEASGRQRVAAVERTAVGTLIFAWAIYSIMQVLASETDEEDDDKTMSERFWLALPMAQRMVGWSPLMLWDSVAGSLSSPITVPFKLLSEAVNTVYTMWIGNEAEKAVAYGRFVDTVLKTTGIGKTASSASDVFTGKTLQEKASDAFWIVNMEDISKAGIARGRKTETQWEALAKALGFDIDAATVNYLWGRFDEMDLEAKYLAKTGSPMMASVWAKIVSSIKGLGRDLVRPVEDLTWLFNPWNEGYDMTQMGVIRQTADMLNEQDSLKSYLVKLWVTNPEAQFAIRDEVNKQFNSLSGTNIDKARFIKEDGRTIEELADTENFGRDMKTMLTENPKLFNDILAGLARVYRNADDLKEFTPEMKEKVKEYMKPSRMWDDAAIAAYYGTSPTTTSLSNALSQGIEDVMKVEKPKDSKLTDAEFALEQLKFIDDSFKSVYVVMPITRSVERSLALKSTELTTKLDKLAETLRIPKTKILDNLPYITRAIDRWLDYRGFREYGTVSDDLVSDNKSEQKSSETLSQTILNKTPWTPQTAIATNPILIEKVKAYDPMKLTPVASQIKQTTQAKSWPRLADLLKR